MTRRTQFAILGAGGLLAVLAPEMLHMRMRAAVQSSAVRKAPLHPLMHIPRAQLGGIVSEVLARTGQQVKAAQLLIRFDAKDLETRIARLQQALRTAQATKTMSAIPTQARQYIYEVHPDTLQAEREYVDALSAMENVVDSARAAAAARLRKATAERGLVRARLARNMNAAANEDELRGFLEQTTTSLAEAQRLLQQAAIRSPADAIVDLLEVHVGDRIQPASPIAILISDHEYSVEFPVSNAEAAKLQIGMRINGLLEGIPQPIQATIESITAHKLPVIARENLRTGEESILRLRLRSNTPLRAGLIAAMELP